MNLQKIIRPIVIAALFAIPVFPLIVSNSLFFPFITGKAFYFRMLVEIAFFGWIILCFLDAKYRPRLNALTISVTLFALVTLIADLLGVNPLRSLWSNFERMEGWVTIIHLWAFYLAATGIFGYGEEGKKWWHRWFNASLIFALIVAGYGLFQLFGWAAIHQGSSRIDASLGNSAYMAVYMLLNAGLAAYLFFTRSPKPVANDVYQMPRWLFAVASFVGLALITDLKYYVVAIIGLLLIGVLVFLYVRKPNIRPSGWQWLYTVLFCLFSFELFETATRGTILGLIGGCMLSLFLYAIFGKGELKASRQISGGIIIVIVLLGLGFWLDRSAGFIQKNEVLSRLASISWSDSSGQARQLIWPMALKGAAQRPFFGWGQENFNYIFNANYNAQMWNQEQWFDRAHSVFLDWLTASGFVGLLAYLALYAFFLTAVWKSASLTAAEKSVLTGLLAGYAIHNVFVFDNLASYAAFFAMLGFAGSLNGDKAPALFGTKAVRTDAVEYIAAPLAIILLVVAGYFIDIRPLQANTRLIDAMQACVNTTASPDLFSNALAVHAYVANQEIREQALSCAGDVITSASSNPSMSQAAQGFFGLAATVVQDQVAATPKDARIYTLAGTFYNQIGQTAQAAPLLEQAHALSPAKQTIDFQLATAYINTGKAADAVALLKQAYEEDPSYPDARSSYAIALVFNGQEAQAHALFGDDPAIFQTERMASVYTSLKKYPQAIAILQALVKADPSNSQLGAQLAQTQYAAGMITAAIQTLRNIETAHPEYKDSIEAAIKQAQAGTAK